MPDSKRFVSPEDIETLEFDWGSLKWMSTPAVTDAEAFSAGVVQLAPEDGHERHNHPDSEEVLYVLGGEGPPDGRRRGTTTPGDMVHIPAGVYHSTINATWEPLRLLAVYAPPGPEDVLRDDPEATELSPGSRFTDGDQGE